MPACDGRSDGQTDRETDRRPAYSYSIADARKKMAVTPEFDDVISFDSGHKKIQTLRCCSNMGSNRSADVTVSIRSTTLLWSERSADRNLNTRTPWHGMVRALAVRVLADRCRPLILLQLQCQPASCYCCSGRSRDIRFNFPMRMLLICCCGVIRMSCRWQKHTIICSSCC